MSSLKQFKAIRVLPAKTTTVAKAAIPAALVAPPAEIPDGIPVTARLQSREPGKISPQGKLPSTKLPKLTKKFLFAGKAVFTVDNGKGEHYTYKVRGKKSEWPVGSGKMSTTYFLSVKHTGGQFPYAYVGLLNPTVGTIKCTAKSAFIPGSREYDVAAWACGVVVNSKMIPDRYEIVHAGKCGRCAKKLTDTTSIERGIGPDCWEMMGN